MPIRDPVLRQIESELDKPLNGDEFEAAMVSMFREQRIYPKIVPVRGGGDAGMDGAIGDPADAAPPTPLVCTTDEDVKGNLIRSLNSYKTKVGARRQVVSATSRKLTPQQQRALTDAAAEAGFVLLNIHERAAVAELLYRSPRWCRDLLGITTSRPALSAYPQDHRPFVDRPLRGRESDLVWLRDRSGDALLVGQPGIGKTFLLRHYAKESDGLFAVTDDVDAIGAGIREERPSAVLVTDAHSKLTLIKSLRQLRYDTGGTWKITADCWPGSESEVRDALALSSDEIRRLRPLPRDTIVEIIHDGGLGGPNELVREIVDQAHGRAGLALTLVWLCLHGDAQHVGLGKVLVDEAERTFKRLVGADALDVLAMFAIGGESGLTLADVATSLQLPPAQVQRIIIQLAAGGVVEEVTDYHGTRRSLVQPQALREALVSDRFFGKFAMQVPKQLLDAARPAAATEVLLGAAHRGGLVPDELLWSRLVEHGTTDLFRSYAALGKVQASRALSERPELLTQLASVGLHRAPRDFLRALLVLAVGDDRETAPNPGHPLRLIQDWVHSGRPGSDAVPRRRLVVDAVESWLGEGGDPNTATRAVSLALVPTFATSNSDPGAGMTVTLTHGLISFEELRDLGTLWRRALDYVPMNRVDKWGPILSAIRELGHPSVFGHGAPADFFERCRELAADVILQLARGASAFPGVLLELKAIADWIGTPISFEIPVEFSILYPHEEWNDYEAWSKAAATAAREIANAFAEKPPADVARTLAHYRAQAGSVGRYGGMLFVFGEALAQKVRRPEEWLDALVETRAGHELVAPLFHRVHREQPAQWSIECRRCLHMPDFRATVVEQVLIHSRTDEALLEQVLGLVPEFTRLVNVVCIRALIEKPTLRRLFAHIDAGVAAAAAVGAWHAAPKGEIDPELKEDWRAAVLRCGPVQQRQNGTLFIGDILSTDRDLGFDWLMARVRDGTPLFELEDYDLSGAIPALSANQRTAFLRAVASNDSAYVPRKLVAVLVGSDINIYRRLLNDAKAKSIHLILLGGHPSETWCLMAEAALDAGYCAEDIVHAAVGDSHSFSGKESEYWEQWRRAWVGIQGHNDPRLKEIARLGAQRATQRREKSLEAEEHEAVYGR